MFKRDYDQAVADLMTDIANLQEAGLNLVQSLSFGAEQCQNQDLRHALTRSQQVAIDGGNWIEALSSILQADELSSLDFANQSGLVAEGFRQLALVRQNRCNQRQRLTQALRYPLTLVLLSLLAFNVLLHYLLPALIDFAHDSQIKLGPVGEVLAFLSTNRHHVAIASSLIPCVFLLFILPKTAAPIRSICLFKLQQGLQVQQLLLSLEQMYKAGLSLQKAVAKLSQCHHHPRIKHDLIRLNIVLSEGESLAQSLADFEWLSHRQRALLHLGERSGKLQQALKQCVSIAENANEHQASKLQNRLQIIAMAIGGGLIAAIVLGVILPIYQSLFDGGYG